MITVASGRAGAGMIAAWAACAVGLLYAAISVYWGLGGTWLLGTVGGSVAKLGRAHNAGVIAAVWAGRAQADRRRAALARHS